jgi:hypothetical protein
MGPATTSRRRRAAVPALTEAAAETAIVACCRTLGLPTIRDEHARIAEAAARNG